MKLSEVKNFLTSSETINFILPSGKEVPASFHVTEIGKVTRHFIDCGGKERFETFINFQLWEANDLHHRLNPGKLLNIISLCEEKLGLADLEVEVEYQQETIGRYGLSVKGKDLVLVRLNTACLALDACGIPQNQQVEKNACAPGSGCC